MLSHVFASRAIKMLAVDPGLQAVKPFIRVTAGAERITVRTERITNSVKVNAKRHTVGVKSFVFKFTAFFLLCLSAQLCDLRAENVTTKNPKIKAVKEKRDLAAEKSIDDLDNVAVHCIILMLGAATGWLLFKPVFITYYNSKFNKFKSDRK